MYFLEIKQVNDTMQVTEAVIGKLEVTVINILQETKLAPSFLN